MSSVQLNNAAIRNYAAYQMQARLQQQLGSGQQMERLSSGSKLNKAADDATTGTTAQDGLQQLGSGQQRLQLIGSGQSITTTNAEETKVGDAVGTTFGDNGVTATISATGAALAAGGTDQRGVEGANVRDFDYSSEITRFAKTFASTAQLGQTPSGSIDRSSDPNITQRSQQTTGAGTANMLAGAGMSLNIGDFTGANAGAGQTGQEPTEGGANTNQNKVDLAATEERPSLSGLTVNTANAIAALAPISQDAMQQLLRPG